MAQLLDLIKDQVVASAAQTAIPDNLKNQVLGGLSDSILGSLTQTAKSANGIADITSLLTGKTSAQSSPVTALAGQLFAKNVTSKLGLDSTLSSAVTALIPTVLGKVTQTVSSGNSSIDLNSILKTLGGNTSTLGKLGGLLGGLFGK